MAIRNIRRQSTVPLGATGSAAPIYVDSDDNKLKMIPAGSGSTEVEVVDASSTQTLTGKTLTAPVITNATIDAPTPVSITTTPITLGATHKNRLTVVDKVDGTAFTLPPATGSGNVYPIRIGTALTSATHTVAAAGSDKFYGGVFINDTGASAAATADFFPAVAGSSVTLTLTQSVGAGAKGDWVEFEDFKSAGWLVRGMLHAEVDPTNPFS